jgi:hypothetical protein
VDVKPESTCDIIFPSPTLEEAQLQRLVPFLLVAFIVVYTGLVGLAVHVEWRAMATLLAPVFWLGLYALFGSDRAEAK